MRLQLTNSPTGVPLRVAASSNIAPNADSSTPGDYTDYAVTVAKDFGKGISASLAGVGTVGADQTFYTGSNGKLISKNGWVLGVKYSF